MVDRIKFSVDNASISEDILKKKFFAKMLTKSGNAVYLYKNNLENAEDDAEVAEDYSYNQKFKKHLYIKYIVYAKPKELPSNGYAIRNELIVHRNLRKDRFGEGSIQDLTFANFEKIIQDYSKKFEITEKVFWNARITKLELGVTLKLNSKMRGILSCFDNFNGITHKNIYGNDGIAFIGENFSVSIYDKLEKMSKNDELFPKSKSKKKLKDKVSKYIYFLRMELKIEKVSGFHRTGFTGKIDRLANVRDNWNHLGKALLELYYDINFVDILSPEVEETIAGQELTPMNNFLKFQGIKAIGKDRFFNQILPLMKGGGTKFRKGYHKLINDLEKKYLVDYEMEFARKLEAKINSIRKKGGSVV